MENKELKIIPPEGYEIDKENSTFDCIKFKPKSLTYENVANKLFTDKHFNYIGTDGTIYRVRTLANNIYYPNNATSEKQLEKLLAINKLMNVAKYLNKGWTPNWNTVFEQCKYYISIVRGSTRIDRLCISTQNTICNTGIVYFKSEELAQQAIDILGEDTIRLAFSTDW